MKPATHPEKPKQKTVLLRAGDIVVAVLVLLLAVVSFFALYVEARPGQTAIVTTPEGEIVLSLSKNTQKELRGKNDIHLVLTVEEGRICFLSSECPDKICVHSGWLSKKGQTAACLPAGIAVRIEGNLDDEPDAILG